MQIALAIPICIVYNIRAGLGLGSAHADVAQVVAHILGKDEVTSSSLVISSSRNGDTGYRNSLWWVAIFLLSLIENIYVAKASSCNGDAEYHDSFLGNDIFYA